MVADAGRLVDVATFVLVHGGWSGAHGWREVRRLLAANGHEVFTPSLTGIGERVHLVSPQVDLTTHVHDVVNLMLFEDLDDVVLVGYSYRGAVVTSALAHISDRVRELVYLDAFVPRNGETVSGLSGRERQTTIAVDDEWLVPPPERHYDDPAEAVWQSSRRVPHPVRCFTESVYLAKPIEDYRFGLSYIKATADSRATRRAAPRSGMPPITRGHRIGGATTRSVRTTWSPATDPWSSQRCLQ